MNSIKRKLIKTIGWLNSKIQSKRRVSNCFITYAGGWDGACAQVHSIISIMLFSKKFNLPYLHTPLQNIEHFKGDRSEWSKQWEKFFSLGYKEQSIASIETSQYRNIYIKYPFLISKKRNTIYRVSNCHGYTDQFAHDYKYLLNELQERYYLNKKENNAMDGEFKICLHIRRGDVSKENKNAFRFTDNRFLIENLKKITMVLKSKNKNFNIYIFSEGSVSDFKDFSDYDPIYRLNADEFKTFNDLVLADILIMAKSSFSYMAALFCKGIVFYEPFWHEPLENWINLKAESNFKSQLNSKLFN